MRDPSGLGQAAASKDGNAKVDRDADHEETDKAALAKDDDDPKVGNVAKVESDADHEETEKFAKVAHAKGDDPKVGSVTKVDSDADHKETEKFAKAALDEDNDPKVDGDAICHGGAQRGRRHCKEGQGRQGGNNRLRQPRGGRNLPRWYLPRTATPRWLIPFHF